ncbi:MAG: RNA polymerase subunit sigma-24 [Bacteroidetes bacterium]|nr:MAG: RNA polymerase subunit sigma-24 [Bacteroidota bacterium]
MTVSQYNQCVDIYSDGLYRFILKNMRSEDHAHDVVQESYVKLWKKHEKVEYEKAKSYLFTTAYHVMIDFFRKEKRISFVEQFNESDLTSYHHQPYVDVDKMINLALEKIPHVQKSALLLRDYEGYSYEEIGEILSLNESQVKVYIYRARKAMRLFIGSLDNMI